MIVEVVLRKQMTLEEYKAMIPISKKKGWEVKAYQVGVFSPPISKEV